MNTHITAHKAKVSLLISVDICVLLEKSVEVNVWSHLKFEVLSVFCFFFFSANPLSVSASVRLINDVGLMCIMRFV